MNKKCTKCSTINILENNFCEQCGSIEFEDIKTNDLYTIENIAPAVTTFIFLCVFIAVIVKNLSYSTKEKIYSTIGIEKESSSASTTSFVSSEENLYNENATDFINAGIQAVSQGEYSRGAEIHQKACDNNDARGCGLLAIMYDIGIGEVHQDHIKAKELFSKACNLGHQKSCEKAATINISEE